MNTRTLPPMHSPGAQALQDLFDTLPSPCGARDILRFNLACQRAAPHLSRTEKHHAERLVDTLIADLNDQAADSMPAGL